MIVCADDYGLSDGIDEAILELCRRGKLSAVSCMVALERCCAESMARLSELKSSVDKRLFKNSPTTISEVFRPMIGMPRLRAGASA